jgi:hypothetical protein
MADAPETATKVVKPKVDRPEKPDEGAYKAELDAAEKVLEKTKAKLASFFLVNQTGRLQR